MRANILNPKGLLFMAAAFAVGFTGCKKEPVVPSLPRIDILVNGEAVTNLKLNPQVGGEEFDITVSATRDWSVTKNADWVTVTPAQGSADRQTPVNIKVNANEGTTRSTTLIFKVSGGVVEQTVGITQQGPDSPGADAIYFEDLGDFKTGGDIRTVSGVSGSTWPTVEQFGSADPNNAWRRGGTVDQSGVTYTGSATVRNSGNLYDPVEGSSISKAPYVHMNNTMNFAINNVVLDGKTNFTFKFGLQHTVSTASEAPYTPTFTPATPTTVKAQAGFDGTAWADLTYTVAEDGNGWYWATSEFKVPAGTTHLYVKFSNFAGESGQSLRLEDFTLTEGGNGSLIEPEGPGEVEFISIADVRALYTGTNYTFTENKAVKGSVIVDFEQNNMASLKNLMISDGTSGIAIRLATDATGTEYPVGAEVQVNLLDLTLSAYQGLVQLGADKSNVVLTGQTKPITPTKISAAQFKSGDYQSMLVEVENVQFVSTAVGKTVNDASFKVGTGATAPSNIELESSDGDKFVIYVSSYAKFFATQTVPSGSGSIFGVGTVAGSPEVIMLLPQTTADFASLTDPRFGEVPAFGVSTTTVAVPAAGGTFTVSVTGNVEWTADITQGGNGVTSGPTPASGTGAGEIALVFSENTDPNSERATDLTVTTTAAVTPNEFTVTFTQAKAGGPSVATFTLVTGGTFTAGEYLFVGKKDPTIYTFNAQSGNGNNITALDITSFVSGNTITDDASGTLAGRVVTAAPNGSNFTLQFTGKYLHAASSSSNYLRLRDEVGDDNAVWSVDVSAQGTATIVANGNYTKKIIRFNASNNPPLFSAYDSGQTDIYIYKKN